MGRQSEGPSVRESPASTEPRALSPRHRVVLACLRAHGGQSTLVELARDVAAHRQNRPPERVSPAATRRVYSELASSRLDDLADQGLIDVSEQTGTVRLLE